MNKKEAPANQMVREFTIRISDNDRKKFHVMSFNSLNINFNHWCNAKMCRENNMQDYQSEKEKTPKFGAGSEYNSERRRRKKFRFTPQNYKIGE